MLYNKKMLPKQRKFLHNSSQTGYALWKRVLIDKPGAGLKSLDGRDKNLTIVRSKNV